jgi:hypothetical protein
MAGLLPLAVARLDFGTEELLTILRIIESYLLLHPEDVMAGQGKGILGPMTGMLGGSTPVAIKGILRVVDLIAQVLTLSAYAGPLVESGMLGSLVWTVMGTKVCFVFVLFVYLSLTLPNSSRIHL